MAFKKFSTLILMQNAFLEETIEKTQKHKKKIKSSAKPPYPQICSKTCQNEHVFISFDLKIFWSFWHVGRGITCYMWYTKNSKCINLMHTKLWQCWYFVKCRSCVLIINLLLKFIIFYLYLLVFSIVKCVNNLCLK